MGPQEYQNIVASRKRAKSKSVKTGKKLDEKHTPTALDKAADLITKDTDDGGREADFHRRRASIKKKKNQYGVNQERGWLPHIGRTRD